MVNEYSLGDLIKIEYKAKRIFRSDLDLSAVGYWSKETEDDISLCGKISSSDNFSPNYFKIPKKDIIDIRRLYLDRLITWEELNFRVHEVIEEIRGNIVEISSADRDYDCVVGRLEECELSKRKSTTGRFKLFQWCNEIGLMKKIKPFFCYYNSFYDRPIDIKLLTTEDLSDKAFFHDMNDRYETVPCPFDLTKLTKNQKGEFMADYEKLIRRVGLKAMNVIYQMYLTENKNFDGHEIGIFMNTAQINLREAEQGVLLYSPVPILEKQLFLERKKGVFIVKPKQIKDYPWEGFIPIPEEYLRLFFNAIDEGKNPLRLLPLSYVYRIREKNNQIRGLIPLDEPVGRVILNAIADNISKMPKQYFVPRQNDELCASESNPFFLVSFTE